ncbi:MAG: hypothetical protein ACJ79A_02650 [Gemmatimonadaceae bacterium]
MRPHAFTGFGWFVATLLCLVADGTARTTVRVTAGERASRAELGRERGGMTYRAAYGASPDLMV